jgi:CrcB protein
VTADAPAGIGPGWKLLWVCAGSALGGGARYLVSLFTVALFGQGFPVGTLVVNVLGSFLMAAIAQAALLAPGFDPDLRLVLTTGVLGGFTTYSAFNQETVAALQKGARGLAATNVGLTLFLCLGAGWLGIVAGRWLAGR